jgi:hypothetical protein
MINSGNKCNIDRRHAGKLPVFLQVTLKKLIKQELNLLNKLPWYWEKHLFDVVVVTAGGYPMVISMV